jgi:hypothetical protein
MPDPRKFRRRGADYFLAIGSMRPLPITAEAFQKVMTEATQRSLTITTVATQNIGGPGHVDTVSIKRTR